MCSQNRDGGYDFLGFGHIANWGFGLMGLLDFFLGSRAATIDDPGQLKDALFQAALRGDQKGLIKLCRANRQIILDNFAAWRKRPRSCGPIRRPCKATSTGWCPWLRYLQNDSTRRTSLTSSWGPKNPTRCCAGRRASTRLGSSWTSCSTPRHGMSLPIC